MVVCELIDGQDIEQALLVRGREVRADGSLLLTLGDRSGAVAATAHEDLLAACEPGAVVVVTGRFHRGELVLGALRAAEPHEYDAEDLLDGPPRDAALMEEALRDLVAQVQNRHLRTLLDRVLGPAAPTWPLYRDAPAAKRYHQAYRHGLLEHSQQRSSSLNTEVG